MMRRRAIMVLRAWMRIEWTSAEEMKLESGT